MVTITSLELADGSEAHPISNIVIVYDDGEARLEDPFVDDDVLVYEIDPADYPEMTMIFVKAGNNGTRGQGEEIDITALTAATCDPDGDGVYDPNDNCPTTPNPDQADLDNDGTGDMCDRDADGDGYQGTLGDGADCNDLDPAINPDATDIPGNSIDEDCDGSDAEADADGDGVPDTADNCPATPNTDQTDTDNDGFGDACDNDDDNDGLPDSEELILGTDPLDDDTDDGGVNDGDEVSNGTDPLNGSDDFGTPATPVRFYFEGWEDYAQTSTSCGAASHPVLGFWHQDTDDGTDWAVDTGGTSSGNTGPSFDVTRGDSSGKYLYIEASGSCTPAVTAGLTSAPFDLTGRNRTELRFWYHMYGQSIGSLTVAVSVDGGGTWDDLWTLSGDQGNQWTQQVVDLSAYDGQGVVMLRFVGETGDGFTSDIAIDDLELYEYVS